MESKKKIAFIILSLFLVKLVYALAPPDIPDHFKGILIIDDQDAAIGTEIEIYVNSVLEGISITLVEGEYDLFVKSGNSGDEIKFIINGIETGNIERKGGETIIFDLILHTDRDNDGINDPEDTLIGDKESIVHNYDNLNIFIDDIDNTTGIFFGTKKIEIKNNDESIIEFNFDFDNANLNLFNINITEQTSLSEGSIVVKGIAFGILKTVYFDKLNGESNAVCIKDSEISSISELTADCTGAEETKISCPSSGEYNCSIENSRFRVSGLLHSGVKELFIAPPSPPPSGDSGGGGGGGGSSGGGGGGGGGGGALFTCNMDWQCGEWSDCIKGVQIRDCNFVKVAQHAQSTQCPEESKPPATSKSCEISKKVSVPEIEEINETEETTPTITTAESTEEESTAIGGLGAITGAIIGKLFTTKGRSLWLDLFIVVIIVTVLFQVRTHYKKMSEANNKKDIKKKNRKNGNIQ